MPITITFANPNAHTVFHSMAEGMWDVRRDDIDTSREAENDAAADALRALIVATPDTPAAVYPLTFPLSAPLLRTARDVLANCMDNADGVSLEDENAGDFLFPGDVTLSPGTASMDSQSALLAAIEYIERSGIAEDDETAAAVLAALDAMVAQQGCEHFDGAVKDGKLTTLMDVIIYG
jgi:hypothetical protein